MINNPILFYISASLIILAAFISLLSKNIIYSLLSAIVTFFSVAILFFMLGSEYNAIIQVAIYGLAVPIIIGISIMFTNSSPIIKKEYTLPYVTLISGFVFILALIWLIKMSLAMFPDVFNQCIHQEIGSYDVILTFAKGIYINYVWAFELVSLLLVIIIAGISMLSSYVKRKGN